LNIGAVLYPTDFSETSEAASGAAREIARESRAALHVVHVVPPVTDPGDAAERLAAIGERLRDGAPVHTALLSGLVARQIVRYAREHGIGLIVLATHGRTGLSRAILGSVAEAVVRLAPCPVLTVPAGLSSGQPAPVIGTEPPEPRRCIVCARATADLVCETCRAHIRAEALERKMEAQRPARGGSPL
jgi:nucleotide-binding universal stress UspA family protein